jgi:hypothetical protein
VTKARVCKGAGQEGSPRVTSHALRNVGECEGMNPHTPKWTPTLGVVVPMDSQIFRGWLQGSKFIGLKSSLYHWKALGTLMFKMGSYDPFGYLKHKLWPKEGSRVKLAIWFPTTKVNNHLISLRVDGVPHMVEKLSTRATTLLWTSLQLKVCTQSYGPPKLRPKSGES